MRIVVIEDEEDVRSNIVEILDSGGFESIDANNGATGLQMIRQYHPDLVLCDIKMGNGDGYAVLQEIRRDPSTAAIPFVFLSAKTDHSDVRHGMNLGADDYLTKPFRRVELLETITARLKKHQACSQSSLVESASGESASCENTDMAASAPQEWVSAISHDLRAPLTTIRMALRMMEMIPDRWRQYLSVAQLACEQGDRLIEQLLDQYVSSTAETDSSTTILDLQPWVEQRIAAFEVQAQVNQQSLTFELSTSIDRIEVSEITLHRVLVELLHNACKYTPPGGAIRLTLEIPATKPTTLRITLRNSAEIPTADLTRIFDRFYRAAPATVGLHSPHNDYAPKGSGLGLALVQSLVKQAQGEISVQSNQGWTTFYVSLPCTIVANP
ncbi:response regulator [Alkalinema sp. FACHB-956]|uniref:hybrid sensor histidine kinase/response regulator n=1 Tax=Alkalinema sp. FACHB-956 TaxID=2692768 RepID=UPI0016836ED3|nr:response regulator [Alkalinema sp. FACHB-956]MBD2328778.1 response regulator [Alkalinema sp. FACHB-956]